MATIIVSRRPSLWLIILLIASTCAIQQRHTFLHASRTRMTMWRGGATNDAKQATTTSKAKRKKPKRKTKAAAKRPRKSTGPTEPTPVLKDNGESSIIWSVVGGSLKLLWTIVSTIMSFVFSLLSPESTPTSSSKGSKEKSDLSQYQDILDSLDVKPKSILAGTFAKACSLARRRGKFLVALTSTDPDIIQILASLPSEHRESFVLWIGRPSPPTLQPSRLSVLAGKKLLASTPPSRSLDRTSTWLADVRDRNTDALEKLIQSQKEREWAKERQAGYQASVQKDTQQRREAVARKAALAAELAAKAAHQQRILERREELLENLPEEPTEGRTDCVTIALRFADGSKGGQRRFAGEGTTLQTLFDWVDAVYGIEREHVQLQTLTGSHTLRYPADREKPLLSLQKKMIAFRVTEVTEEEDDDEATKASETKDEDESEGEGEEDDEEDE